MVIICTVDPSKLHDSTVDSTFLFGNVEVCYVSHTRDVSIFQYLQLVVSAITLLFSFIVAFTFVIASALKIMNQERKKPSTETEQSDKENYHKNQTLAPNNYGSTNNFLESTGEHSSKPSDDSNCSLQSLGDTKRIVDTSTEDNLRPEQTPLIRSNLSDRSKSSVMQFLLLLLFLLFSCLVVC